MPDMQTALGKALEEGKRRFLSATLSEWDEHEQAIRQPQPPQEKVMQPTTQITKSGNMRRDLFAFIKDNAYKYTARHVTDKFEELGYNAGSAHTALVQMKRAGIVTADANSRLYTLTETYKTFNNPYTAVSRARKKAAKAVKTTKSAGIAALAGPVAAPAAVPAYKVEPMPTVLTAEYVMARIGVAEAHKLYVELGKMFGGK